MASVLNYLPPGDGFLPKWLLLVSFHTAQCQRQGLRRHTATCLMLGRLLQHGLTSQWQVSVVSMANSIQAYATLSATRRVYSGPKQSVDSSKRLPDGIPARTVRQDMSPVTALSARTFGTWTAITSVIRLYAAYHIHDQAVYELAFWSFGVAWAHFMSEWLIFKTTSWGSGLAGPVIVSTSSLVWMWSRWDYYVKG